MDRIREPEINPDAEPWTKIADNAPICASENCNRMGVAAVWRLEFGDCGSSYCAECKEHIEAQ